jgi:predicted RNA polymerase sigma factor
MRLSNAPFTSVAARCPLHTSPKTGRVDEAREADLRALSLTANSAEQLVLQKRIACATERRSRNDD